MIEYKIEDCTKEDCEVIIKGIFEYNHTLVPFTQSPPVALINRVIKDEDKKAVAGINCILYGWNCMFIDVLWVDVTYRGKGYGTALLENVEKLGKEKGCELIHLDTFDFQAKGFFAKHGYEVFGVLDDCPQNHKRFYMKKKIK